MLIQSLGAAQNSESKKEEFRKYLERAGVIDALTKGEPIAQQARWACLPCRTVPYCAVPSCAMHCRAAPVTTPSRLVVAVLVALYETSEKPANALE